MSVDDEYTLNNSGPYKTPQKFGKQIQQRTYECNKNFPKSKRNAMCYYKPSNLPKVKFAFYTEHNVTNNRLV